MKLALSSRSAWAVDLNIGDKNMDSNINDNDNDSHYDVITTFCQGFYGSGLRLEA